jgi:preprotein translocase subunit SecG
VKAGGINKLTAVLAGVFLVSIVAIDACQSRPGTGLFDRQPAPSAPEQPK